MSKNLEAIKVIREVVLLREGETLDGFVLPLDTVQLKSEKLKVMYAEQIVGEAVVREVRGSLVADLQIVPNEPKEIWEQFVAMKGNVGEATEKEIKSFRLEELTVTETPANDDSKTLDHYREVTAQKIVVGQMIRALQKKGWTKRRIKRHLFQKHNIIIE